MPASMVLHIRPTENCQADKMDGGMAITSLGKILYSYMKQQQIDSPELFIKNYTFSPVYIGERSPKSFNINAKKGTLCWFRLSSLEEKISDSVFNVLYQNIVTQQIPVLKSKVCDFEVVRAISTPSSKHPWVNTISIQKLLTPTSKDDEEALIDFFSPTVFSENNAFVPLPTPNLVYRSLAESWNKIVPEHKIEEDIISEVANNIAIVLYKNLNTNIHTITGGNLRIGFMGKVRFRLLKKDPHLLRYFNLLSDVSFYSGLGKDTGMGCGMARRIPRSKWALQRDLLK